MERTVTFNPPVLLALDAGFRESGWAIFKDEAPIESGTISLPGRRTMEHGVRVSHLIDSLDELAAAWSPELVAICHLSGIHWEVPALNLLESSLLKWSSILNLPQFSYTTREVRKAIAGDSQATSATLVYATMVGSGSVGQKKSTAEWKAIAVGYCHLIRKTEIDPVPA